MSQRLQAHGKPAPQLRRTVLGKVHWAGQGDLLPALRSDHILVAPGAPAPEACAGYAGLLTAAALPDRLLEGLTLPVMHGASPLDHLGPGDVIALQPGGLIRTLYRKRSPHNALFATAQCNSYCLMCSQPPIPVDDRGRIREHLRLIELIDPETPELGITGGEPTLLKSGFLQIVERARDLLPRTALHVLSNGRLFYYGSFARALAMIEHPDLVVGVPLYSDLDFEHDFVVQAAGAFDETLAGLQNLGRYGVAVEIRVVIHRLTVPRLLQLAEFIYRNLPFSAHVALMGLEMTGFTIPNLEALWIDPVDYGKELVEATTFLAARGLHVSIYNHPLCVVPRQLWPFCRQSISDWKNEYLPLCTACAVRESCGGFFTSVVKKRISRGVLPLRGPLPDGAAEPSL
jgi:His-Xaa-Ser system radical SAM maturase HxsC